MKERPRVGISSCLLGEAVRYDGGHKRHGRLVETLGPWVEWVPVCPEMEVGMGTPRETIRLVRTAEGIRLRGTASGIDHTGAMHAYARPRVEALAKAGLDGYVLKKDSPSCGMTRVAVHGPEEGRVSSDGVGLFARVLIERLPLLPVEQEDRLDDPLRCQEFLDRIIAYRAYRAYRADRADRADRAGRLSGVNGD